MVFTQIAHGLGEEVVGEGLELAIGVINAQLAIVVQGRVEGLVLAELLVLGGFQGISNSKSDSHQGGVRDRKHLEERALVQSLEPF